MYNKHYVAQVKLSVTEIKYIFKHCVSKKKFGFQITSQLYQKLCSNCGK